MVPIHQVQVNLQVMCTPKVTIPLQKWATRVIQRDFRPHVRVAPRERQCIFNVPSIKNDYWTLIMLSYNLREIELEIEEKGVQDIIDRGCNKKRDMEIDRGVVGNM